jgi:manganese transport protein
MKLKRLIASLLPGIFLIGYNIGTGSITSMSKSGANFGMDLLWAVLLSCLITYYLINLFSKYTMVTGETVIQGMKKHISPALVITLIIALSMIILAALMGVIGIIADVLAVWADTQFEVNTSPTFWAILVASLVYVLVYFGNYASFEKILAILVSIMGLAFIITMFIDFPSIGDILAGLVPKLPEATVNSDNSAYVIVAGMVGTTVSVFAFIIRSQIVKDTGWKMADMRIQKRDAVVSASLMFILSAAVIITATSTLYANGLKMNSVSEMIPLLEPLAGDAALGIFVLGIIAAGLSSHLPNLLVIPWLIIDYKGEEGERDTRKPLFRWILLGLSIVSVIGTVLGFKPIFVLLVSQACIAIVLPLTLVGIFYLTSKKSLMKEYRNSRYEVALNIAILVLSFYLSFLAIGGLWQDLFSSNL